jgi:hypothetical protein
MTMKRDADVASIAVTSPHDRPCGKPMCGSPAGTGPRIEMSWSAKSKIQLAAIIATTATRPPGIILR